MQAGLYCRAKDHFTAITGRRTDTSHVNSSNLKRCLTNRDVKEAYRNCGRSASTSCQIVMPTSSHHTGPTSPILKADLLVPAHQSMISAQIALGLQICGLPLSADCPIPRMEEGEEGAKDALQSVSKRRPELAVRRFEKSRTLRDTVACARIRKLTFAVHPQARAAAAARRPALADPSRSFDGTSKAKQLHQQWL